jgi:hypothetical protein
MILRLSFPGLSDQPKEEYQNPVSRNSFFRKLCERKASRYEKISDDQRHVDTDLEILYEHLTDEVFIKTEQPYSDVDIDDGERGSQRTETSHFDSDKSYEESAQCRKRAREEKTYSEQILEQSQVYEFHSVLKAQPKI